MFLQKESTSHTWNHCTVSGNSGEWKRICFSIALLLWTKHSLKLTEQGCLLYFTGNRLWSQIDSILFTFKLILSDTTVRTERNTMGMENGFMINKAILLEYLLAYLYVYFAHSVYFFPLHWEQLYLYFNLFKSSIKLKYDFLKIYT